jgi:hypothetical protein
VNHKSSLQGITLQSPAFPQIRLQQNAASGFQINGLGILHGRRKKDIAISQFATGPFWRKAAVY